MPKKDLIELLESEIRNGDKETLKFFLVRCAIQYVKTHHELDEAVEALCYTIKEVYRRGPHSL